MSTITTAGRWIALPTALGAADRARADQPADGALVQVLASNATLACRENGLRTLWERPPSDVLYDTYGSNNPLGVQWDKPDLAGIVAQHAGVHRIRFWGETGQAPRLVLATRGVAYTGYTLGIALYAIPLAGSPLGAIDPPTGLFYPPEIAVARTSSTSWGDLTATLVLTPQMLSAGARSEAPAPGAVPPVPVVEMGPDVAFSLWVAAWSTANSIANKASMGAMTIYLEEPA